MKKIISPIYKIKGLQFEIANILNYDSYSNKLVINYRLPKKLYIFNGSIKKEIYTKHYFIQVDNIEQEINNIETMQNKFDELNLYYPLGKIIQTHRTARFKNSIELSVINDINIACNNLSYQVILKTNESDIKIVHDSIENVNNEIKLILDKKF